MIKELLKLADHLDSLGLESEADEVDNMISKASGSGWGGMAQGMEAGYSVENGKIYYRDRVGGSRKLVWEPGDAVPDALRSVPLLRAVLPESTR